MTSASNTRGRPPAELRVPEEVVGRSLGEDLLVHRFDTDEVFVLNPDARVIFEAIQHGEGRDGAYRRVTALGFEGDSVVDAVDQTIHDLLAHGVVITAPSA